MRITFVTRKFGNVERNSHCDVLHITPITDARLFLDCNGDFAIQAYVLCTNYVVFMCIFFTLLCLLATTRNPCVALQRQLSIGNYEVAFVHFINHWL